MDPDDAPFSFSCQRSGNCCAIPGGFVAVSPDEAEAMAGLLGMAPEAFSQRYLSPDRRRLRAGLGHACVFLDSGYPAACRVYEARPARCASWPYWEELRDPERLAAARRRCPGLQPREG